MTDKEKLEKIVAYLMRRMYAHNQMADIGSTGEVFDEKIENAKYEECKDALNFIDSMQEEPVSEDLEKEIEKMWAQESKCRDTDYTIAELTKQDYEDCARHFANWQKTKDESTTEDLGEYINELSKQFPEVSFAKLSRIAVRVAKWQKQQDNNDANHALIEQIKTQQMCYEKGMADMKQQMTKEAISGKVTVIYYPTDSCLEIEATLPEGRFEDGDKVLIIKEE